jgi:hypothetical protein
MAERMAASESGKVPAGQGFRTPEGYFDTFGDRLEQRLKKKSTPVRTLRSSRLFWIPAAAAAILILFLWGPSSPANGPGFGDIQGEVLEAYLQTDEFDLTPGELAENIPLGDIAMEDVLDNAPGALQIAEYLEDYIESDEELYWDPNE